MARRFSTRPQKLMDVKSGVSSKDDREVQLRLSRLPRQAREELEKANNKLSRRLANRVRRAAKRDGARHPKQAAIIPIGVRNGPTPGVWAGGNQLVGRRRKPAWKLIYGAEFGARVLRQYRAWSGAGTGSGYWFFPTLRKAGPQMRQLWNEAADKVTRKFGRG